CARPLAHPCIGRGCDADDSVFSGTPDRARHGRLCARRSLSARIHRRTANHLHPDVREVRTCGVSTWPSHLARGTLQPFVYTRPVLFNALPREREEVQMQPVPPPTVDTLLNSSTTQSPDSRISQAKPFPCLS